VEVKEGFAGRLASVLGVQRLRPLVLAFRLEHRQLHPSICAQFACVWMTVQNVYLCQNFSSPQPSHFTFPV